MDDVRDTPLFAKLAKKLKNLDPAEMCNLIHTDQLMAVLLDDDVAELLHTEPANKRPI